MNLLKELHQIKEDAAIGATTSSSIGVNQSAGFSKISKDLKKKKIIKRLFSENKEYDQFAVMSQIRNAEQTSAANKNVAGFALEDDNGNIIKVFVQADQAQEFDEALKGELSSNQNDEHNHREIGEIIYNLKKDFNIINIDMGSIPEDEEEMKEIGDTLDRDTSDMELDDKSDDEDLGDLDDEMEPNLDQNSEDVSGATSALTAVIDMMKADAEARKSESEAKSKESEAKIARLNTQAAEAHTKKSEEIMDMEAYYSKKSDTEKEAKTIAKLSKYKHELSQDDIIADIDHIQDSPLVGSEENEETQVSNKILNAALLSLLKNKYKS